MNKIPIVSNYIIDKEHQDILDIFHKLNESCTKHIINENKLIDLRNKIKPDNHINIQLEIDNHKKEHEKILIKIKELEKEILNHIKRQDIIHFHKI